MEHKPVKSSHLRSVGYDPDTRTMQVAFQNGSVYEYEDVSPEAHRALLASESKGKTFRGLLVDGIKGKKVEVRPDPRRPKAPETVEIGPGTD